MRKASLCLGAGVLASAGIAIPAEAATTGVVARVSGNVVVYTATPGRANKVVLTRTGATLTVDDVYGIRAGAGCAAVRGDTTRITCAGAVWVRVDLGDRNDTLVNNSGLGMTAWGRSGDDKITGGPLRDDISGGDGADAIWGLGGADVLRGENGNDAISGGDANDQISGGNGHDRLLGGNGNDVVADGPGHDKASGGPGDDTFRTGQGNDVFDGGDGNDEFDQPRDYPAGTDRDVFIGGPGIADTVDYRSRTRPVTADADGVAGDDGSGGEGDTISGTVEVLGGGNAADRLLGTTRAEGFFGGPGNDTIAAGGGDDLLWGEDGRDYLNGAAGNDICADAEARDTILSCEGDDVTVTSTDTTRLADLAIKVRAGRE